MVTVGGVRLGRPSDLAIRMETSRSVDYNPSCQILGVTAERCIIVTRQFPLPPNIE